MIIGEKTTNLPKGSGLLSNAVVSNMGLGQSKYTKGENDNGDSTIVLM